MSAGNRRVGKRSIIGSSVAVLNKDGLWRQGKIVGIRNDEERLMPFEKNYEVEIRDGKCWDRFYCEDDLIGPGFSSTIPPTSKLVPGQFVYVTHEGREVSGTVLNHHVNQDCVTVKIEGDRTIFKTLEEIRLIESRKSARLGKSVLDFSKLAEMGHLSEKRPKEGQNRRRLHSESSFIDAKQNLIHKRKRQQSAILPCLSDRIDVPVSRKRRTSESRLSDAESGYTSAGSSSGFGSSLSSSFRSRDELRDCTAAMVLMNLSTSPVDRWQVTSASAGASPTLTPHPSPVPSPADNRTEDEEPTRKCARSMGVMYKCTWRGCQEVSLHQDSIERHVRGHLGRQDPLPGEERDMEEEFYYNEIELDVDLLSQHTQDIMAADIIIDTSDNSDSTDTDSLEDKIGESLNIRSPASPSSVIFHNYTPRLPASRKPVLSGEVPVVRRNILPGESLLATSAPPSLSFIPENGVFKADIGNVVIKTGPSVVVSSAAANVFVPPGISEHMDMVKPPPSSSPILVISPGSTEQTSLSWGSGKKLVSIVPKPDSVKTPAKSYMLSPPGQTIPTFKSDKKCRKLYGLEQKDLWCTQCKWKKACARFN